MLAVLRRDGIMMPFAAFKGNDWSQPWPVNLFNIERPAMLSAIPNGWWGGRPYEQWSAVLTRGQVTPLELRSPIVLPVCEERRLGIRTNYRSPEMSPAILVQPYPKEGLAVTPGVRVDPIEIVAATDPRRSRVALTLADAIDEAEEETIRTLRRKTEFDHPIDPEVRRKVVAQLEAWYRAPMDAHGWMLSYVEAAKRYPPGPGDEGCGLETVVSGWVQENAIEKALEGLAPYAAIEPRPVEIGGLTFTEVASITELHGGIATNVIPDRAVANVNFRYAPDRSPSSADAYLRSLVPEGASYEHAGDSPPARVVTDSALVRRLREAGDLELEPKQAWTNVADFTSRGIDAVNFGPGATRYAHRRDEQVEIAALERAYVALRSFLAGSV